MAAITVQNVTVTTSLTPSFAAASATGDYFQNNGKILLYFKNASVAEARTVTISAQAECNQGHEHDITVTVSTSSEEIVGFFRMNRFNDKDGRVQITYDNHADLTVAAISVE